MSDTVTVEMDRELAQELSEILRHEVEHADEIHQTENTMLFAANLIDDTLGS
jgi:predicted small metal-binding protein